ncbi:MAG: lactate utilization protein B [Ignisphaera sp.]|nr:lactate utilization protein [Ignisphaera sp.]MDW8085579.1 lactate utilization protein B [Ignisphaera sp.]
MAAWFDEYVGRIVDALGNDMLRVALGKVATRFPKARLQLLKDLPYYEYYRKRVREVRAWSLDRIDELVKIARENMEKTGAVFHHAATGEEAIKYITTVLRNRGAKLVIKGKSMVTEEISLNRALMESGFDVVETDLGEFLIQIRGEKPSHPVVPAIHLTVDEIAKSLSTFLNRDVPPEHSACVKAVREYLRERFFKADAGITGANAIAADTGTVVLVENEGNVRFVSNAPPVHIVVTGIEKVYPTVEDAVAASMLIIPNAVGLKMPSYISLITGPSSTSDIELVSIRGAHGPQELHVVLLDNGRTKMLRDSSFREALMCLKCGTCLNICPVYRELSGLVWGHVYSGGIGAIWASFIYGPEKAAPLAFTCLQCGRCKTVCPMEIDVPEMILKLRAQLVEAGYIPPPVEKVVRNIEEYGNPYGVPEKGLVGPP